MQLEILYCPSTAIMCNQGFHFPSSCTGFAAFVSYFQIFLPYSSFWASMQIQLCNCSVTHSPTCKISLWVGPAGSWLTVSATLACSYALLRIALVFTSMILSSEQVTHLIITAVSVFKPTVQARCNVLSVIGSCSRKSDHFPATIAKPDLLMFTFLSLNNV